MLKEFKEFAVKGNVVDMAVGIIIGSAFTGVVNSLVKDIIMPPIGLLTGGMNFDNQFLVLKAGADGATQFNSLQAAVDAGATVLKYGSFTTLVLNFIIVAFAVFLLVRAINQLRRKEQEKPTSPTEKNCPYCQSSIAIKATRCPHCTSELETAA